MIASLDHLTLACPNIDAGAAVYTALLGREPDWSAQDGAGTASVFYQLENMGLELIAPAGAGPTGRRLRDIIEREGPGLKSIVFGCADLAATRRLFERRALNPDEAAAGESLDLDTHRVRAWRRCRLDDAATHGVRIFVLERAAGDPLVPRATAPAAARALDHVVINTGQPERAVALYGGRLGLRLALDRSHRDWDARLLFFRVGGVTVEIAHRLSAGLSEAPDRLWGATWVVDDIEGAHARLLAAGFPVSEIRAGRRAGTRVATVRDGALGVPTLILSSWTGRSEAAPAAAGQEAA